MEKHENLNSRREYYQLSYHAGIKAISIGYDAYINIHDRMLNCFVHSVFDDALNIIIDNRFFLSVIDRKYGSIPFGITVKKDFSFRKLNIHAGSHLLSRDGSIYCKDIEIIKGLREARLTKHQPDMLEISSGIENLKEMFDIVISALIDQENKDPGLFSLHSCFNEYISKGSAFFQHDDFLICTTGNLILSLITPMIDEDIEKSKNILFQLVGMGNGLTPSGDDFILGCLCFLRCMKDIPVSFVRGLSDELIKEIPGKTTDISESYLVFGLSGKYTETLYRFIKSCSDIDKHEIRMNAKNLIKVGHSSGIDIITGCLFAMMTMIMKKCRITYFKEH